MPEKMVGLNRNVHGTITVGAGGGCRWESLTFPWGCVSSILPQSSRVVLDACLSTGSTRRWKSQRWAVGVANWWEWEGEDKGWRRCWEHPLEHPLGQVEQGKACYQVQPSCSSPERKAAQILPSDWSAVCPDHSMALPWKGTCDLNIFLLKTCHSIMGEPHPSSLDSKFLLREHELLGQSGV